MTSCLLPGEDGNVIREMNHSGVVTDPAHIPDPDPVFWAIVENGKEFMMAKQGVETRHSETAIFAALYRAVAQKESKTEGFGPDYLAEYFLPLHWRFLLQFRKIRGHFKHKSHTLIPGMYEYVLARTAFFDKLFREALMNNIPQIVLLGAGYDTRAYRFAERNLATKIFELDIATTQQRKRKCLTKSRIDIPNHVTLVPIDFNHELIQDVLKNAGYDSAKQTLFIWEGVSYYLEPASVDATLEFVRQASAHNSEIAFDYATSIGEEQMKTCYGVKEFVQTWAKHHSNEPFRSAIHDGTIASFLEQRGLQLLHHLDHQEIENTFLVRDNGALLGQITGLFRFATASPHN